MCNVSSHESFGTFKCPLNILLRCFHCTPIQSPTPAPPQPPFAPPLLEIYRTVHVQHSNISIRWEIKKTPIFAGLCERGAMGGGVGELGGVEWEEARFYLFFYI